MGTNIDLQLGYVPAMCWFYAKDKIRKLVIILLKVVLNNFFIET